jgi:hypothetical protein
MLELSTDFDCTAAVPGLVLRVAVDTQGGSLYYPCENIIENTGQVRKNTRKGWSTVDGEKEYVVR